LDYSKSDFIICGEEGQDNRLEQGAAAMPKSVFTDDYAAFVRHLREAREAAGLTQEQLALRLGLGQSFVSKVERGERRLDVVELGAVCAALGVPLVEFVGGLELRSQQPNSAHKVPEPMSVEPAP